MPSAASSSARYADAAQLAAPLLLGGFLTPQAEARIAAAGLTPGAVAYGLPKLARFAGGFAAGGLIAYGAIKAFEAFANRARFDYAPIVCGKVAAGYQCITATTKATDCANIASSGSAGSVFLGGPTAYQGTPPWSCHSTANPYQRQVQWFTLSTWHIVGVRGLRTNTVMLDPQHYLPSQTPQKPWEYYPPQWVWPELLPELPRAPEFDPHWEVPPYKALPDLMEWFPPGFRRSNDVDEIGPSPGPFPVPWVFPGWDQPGPWFIPGEGGPTIHSTPEDFWHPVPIPNTIPRPFLPEWEPDYPAEFDPTLHYRWPGLVPPQARVSLLPDVAIEASPEGGIRHSYLPPSYVNAPPTGSGTKEKKLKSKFGYMLIRFLMHATIWGGFIKRIHSCIDKKGMKRQQIRALNHTKHYSTMLKNIWNNLGRVKWDCVGVKTLTMLTKFAIEGRIIGQINRTPFAAMGGYQLAGVARRIYSGMGPDPSGARHGRDDPGRLDPFAVMGPVERSVNKALLALPF